MRGKHLSIGSVVALIALIDNAYTPIAIFNVIYVQYKLNKTAWLRFMGLLDLKEDIQLEQGTDFAALLNEIRVEDLSFSYESKEVLKSVSLTIKRGEKIAFVGESGSGKSTLIKILVGLLKYDKRNIFFDNESLRDISLESLYKKVFYLSQDMPVFDGTIKENLVFDNQVSEADIQICLEKTGLLSMVAALDKGVETRIGEKGTCLSGGEKQRLALARLWFENPDIVVLDEATSALDNVTEGIVMKNVLDKINSATVIAVSHRLTSIREFDKIFVFRNGKIVSNGTFEELLENNRYFFDLYRKEKENS